MKLIVTNAFQILSHSLILAEKAHGNILKFVPHMYNPDVFVEDFY